MKARAKKKPASKPPPVKREPPPRDPARGFGRVVIPPNARLKGGISFTLD